MTVEDKKQRPSVIHNQTDDAPIQKNPETNEVKFKINKPIKGHGEDITEFVFREPTAGDISTYGNPIILDFTDNTVRITFDEKKMTAMMAGLAAVPPSTIKAMRPSDWNTCAYLLANFFVPDLTML